MAFSYMHGERILVLLPLDSSSADIEVGDAITASGATSGYYKEVDAAGEAVVGIAASKVASPASDGGVYVKVDVSQNSVYRVPADAGSVTAALLRTTMDVGADARSADINGSSTDDIYVLDVDTATNEVIVQLRIVFAGVA